MDSYLEWRLNRIEGLLTKFLIDSKVSEKTAQKALDLALDLHIELKAQAKTTHTKEFINQEAYEQMFGNVPVDEPVSYGPPASEEGSELHKNPQQLQGFGRKYKDLTEEELNNEFEDGLYDV